MNAITLHDIDYAYHGTELHAVRKLSLVVPQETVCRITGRNGAGKSTVLKLAAGILVPSRGTVRQSGRVVYLNQNAYSFTAGHLTVWEQLQASGARDRMEIKKLLAAYNVDLEYRLDDFVSELSGGQRQIIALLAALQSPVDILCLDEFMSAMDPESVKRTMHILKKERATHNLTIMYVSHAGSLFENEMVLRL